MSGQSHTYYHQSVHFSVADKWLFGSYKYSTSGYGLGYAVGTVGGSSGGSRSFTAQSTGTIPSSGSYSNPPHSFMNAGDIEYDSTKDRAFVFDTEHLYSLSVGSDGVLKQSSLLEVQSNHTDNHVKKVISIPNSDHVVLFFNDENNSDRVSYRVVQFTKGADATSDILTLVGSNVEITTQTGGSYTPAAYSPDVDGFLLKPYVTGAQPFIGVRVARTTTNIKASGTTERFLGVATSSVSDGQSVDIAVAGSVATMASGGMTMETPNTCRTTEVSEPAMPDMAPPVLPLVQRRSLWSSAWLIFLTIKVTTAALRKLSGVRRCTRLSKKRRNVEY